MGAAVGTPLCQLVGQGEATVVFLTSLGEHRLRLPWNFWLCREGF